MSDEEARPDGSRGCLTVAIGVGAFLVLAALAGVAGLAYLESLARQEERDRLRRREAEDAERRSRVFPTEVRSFGRSTEARARVYGEAGALRFDIGRLRLELAASECSRDESFFMVIAAPAGDRQLTSRSGAELEHRLERGEQRCRFKGLPFTIKDGALAIGDVRLAIAEGPPTLVRLRLDPEDPVMAVEIIK